MSLLTAAQRPLLDALPIAALAELTAGAIELYAAAIEAGRGAGSGGMQRTLEAVDALVALERRMDDAERGARLALAHDETMDARLFMLALRIVAECERAVDAVTTASLILRDHLTTG